MEDKNYYQKEADFLNSITVNGKPINKFTPDYLMNKDEIEGFPRKKIEEMIGQLDQNKDQINNLQIPLPFIYNNENGELKYYKGELKIKILVLENNLSIEENVKLLENCKEINRFIELTDDNLYIFENDNYEMNHSKIYHKNNFNNNLFVNYWTNEIVKISL